MQAAFDARMRRKPRTRDPSALIQLLLRRAPRPRTLRSKIDALVDPRLSFDIGPSPTDTLSAPRRIDTFSGPCPIDTLSAPCPIGTLSGPCPIDILSEKIILPVAPVELPATPVLVATSDTPIIAEADSLPVCELEVPPAPKPGFFTQLKSAVRSGLLWLAKLLE